MLTAFGRELRKLRIDRAELLKDMAENLNVTASYLSAVEHGKREIPSNWVEKISKKYRLDESDIEKLREAADQSKLSITIKLINGDYQKNTLVNAFARKFDSLNESEIDKMMDILNKERRKR